MAFKTPAQKLCEEVQGQFDPESVCLVLREQGHHVTADLVEGMGLYIEELHEQVNQLQLKVARLQKPQRRLPPQRKK